MTLQHKYKFSTIIEKEKQLINKYENYLDTTEDIEKKSRIERLIKKHNNNLNVLQKL